VDRAKKGSRDGFTVWADITPLHNELLDTILAAPIHIIATLRARTAYEIEKDERTGKNAITRLGLQPVQRDGVEYEFDVIGDMTLDNTLMVTKSRMEALSGRVIARPGPEVAEEIAAWLTEGAPAPTGASFSPATDTGSYEKPKLIARIRELAAEASALNLTFDLSDLETETEADLLRIGQTLRTRIDRARTRQQEASSATTGGTNASQTGPTRDA
jgi:hypothetical protein